MFQKKSRTGPGASSVVQNLSSTNVVIDLFLRKGGRIQNIKCISSFPCEALQPVGKYCDEYFNASQFIQTVHKSCWWILF